jgi:hypothetical protein
VTDVIAKRTLETIPIVPATEEVALYEIRKKIYPRAVHGAFARWRWAVIFATQIVFYGVPWLTWNGRQAVLFDLGARKFYIGGLVFWPQDVIYLAVLLILAALALFLFTTIAGRLWCGYACPQTVYTRSSRGSSARSRATGLRRIRLDAAPFSLEKLVIKGLKHSAWLAVALWTGYTFVATSRRSARSAFAQSRGSSARGKRSGCCSTHSPRGATRASCASRCASTCAPMRDFRG